jgi:pimeloyl-ACP methyl ester carboxylesterase
MRRRLVGPLLFVPIAAALLSYEPPRAQAQGNDPIEETFLTADGVQLRGLFLKSAKNPGTDPVVILLYPPGKDNNMEKGDWKGLAATLSKEGYNVFRFDWRGHGKSTDIKDTARFWNIQGPNDQFPPNPFTGPWNNGKMIVGAPPQPNKRIKNDLFFKDLKVPDRYAPTLILDLAAVRYHLDSKNDAGDVNTSSIYLIGSDTAATLGIAWLATEWNRPAIVPTPNQLAVMAPGAFPTYRYVPQPLNGGVTDEAGANISGAIWLSPSRPTTVNELQVKNWVSKTAPKLRENNPMLFLYADKDTKGKAQAEFFFNEVLVANPKPGSPLQKLEQTFIREVKGANTLSGVNLLGQDATLGTESTILKFLAAIQKERAKLIRKNRGFTGPWSIQLSGTNPGFGFLPP